MLQIKPITTMRECGYDAPPMSEDFFNETIIDVTFRSDGSVTARGAEILYTVDDVRGEGIELLT